MISFIWLSNQTRVTHICGDVHSNTLGGIIITSISDNPMVTNNQGTPHWTQDPTSPSRVNTEHRSNVITTMNTKPSNYEHCSLNLNQFFPHLYTEHESTNHKQPQPILPSSHETSSPWPLNNLSLTYSSLITGNLIMSWTLGLVCPKVS